MRSSFCQRSAPRYCVKVACTLLCRQQLPHGHATTGNMSAGCVVHHLPVLPSDTRLASLHVMYVVV